MSDPSVAIIVVCRSEPVDRLRRLFRACVAQRERCPVYVAAPLAESRSIAAAAQGLEVDVRFVSNPDGRRSAGLNRASAAAEEAILCRLDARTRPPSNYVDRCVRSLEDPAIGVVGGVQRPVPGDGSVRARAIARALANPYVLGAAPYRIGRRSGAVDTVYLGAFRRSELLELGGYDEALEANEDFELAARYRASGQVVWLDADMVHDYEARGSLKGVVQQYRSFGRAKVSYWRRTSVRPQARQVAAIAGVVGAAATLAASRRRLPLVALGVMAVGLVDHVAQPEERSVALRSLAVLVEILVPVAWVAGVLEEAVRTAPRSSGIR